LGHANARVRKRCRAGYRSCHAVALAKAGATALQTASRAGGKLDPGRWTQDPDLDTRTRLRAYGGQVD